MLVGLPISVAPRAICKNALDETPLAMVPTAVTLTRFGAACGVIVWICPLVSATKLALVVVPAVVVEFDRVWTRSPGRLQANGDRQIWIVVGFDAHVPAVARPLP